jgi:hypothetical protein
MQLIPQYSHMPFQVGSKTYLCISAAPTNFLVNQTATAQRLGVPQQNVEFQPWSLAVFDAGVLTPINVEGLLADSPTRVFCNPVVVEDKITFIHGRTLYSATLNPDGILSPIAVQDRVFSGYCVGGVINTTLPNKCGGSNVLFNGLEIQTPLDAVLRYIPQGNGFIVSGNGESYLYDGAFRRITVSGEDVYKCCIDGEYLIYAKKGASFEDRSIHKDLFELT